MLSQKECSTDICYNIHEPGKHCLWKRSHTIQAHLDEMSEHLFTWSPSVEPSLEPSWWVQNPCSRMVVLALRSALRRRNELLTNEWRPLIYISPWLQLLLPKAGRSRVWPLPSPFIRVVWGNNSKCVCLFCSSRLLFWPAGPQSSEGRFLIES